MLFLKKLLQNIFLTLLCPVLFNRLAEKLWDNLDEVHETVSYLVAGGKVQLSLTSSGESTSQLRLKFLTLRKEPAGRLSPTKYKNYTVEKLVTETNWNQVLVDFPLWLEDSLHWTAEAPSTSSEHSLNTMYTVHHRAMLYTMPCVLLWTRTLSPSLNFSCRMEINVGFIRGCKVKGTVAWDSVLA